MRSSLQPPASQHLVVGSHGTLDEVDRSVACSCQLLHDVRESGAEGIVFHGDIVGYGASPAECVDIVRKLGGCCVMGNHDVEIRKVRRRGCSFRDPGWKSCGYQAGLAHSAHYLDADQAEWLTGLPFRLKIPGAVVAHASLNEPESFDYIRNSAEAEPTLAILRKERSKVGFFGHTHAVGIFAAETDALEWLDASRVRIPPGLACAVTVGAVGQPRHETDLRAAWVQWDPAESVVEFRKTDYDRLQAAQDIIEAGLPLESALRLVTDDELASLIR